MAHILLCLKCKFSTRKMCHIGAYLSDVSHSSMALKPVKICCIRTSLEPYYPHNVRGQLSIILCYINVIIAQGCSKCSKAQQNKGRTCVHTYSPQCPIRCCYNTLGTSEIKSPQCLIRCCYNTLGTTVMYSPQCPIRTVIILWVPQFYFYIVPNVQKDSAILFFSHFLTYFYKLLILMEQ